MKVFSSVLAWAVVVSAAVAITCNSKKPQSGPCGAEADCGPKCTGTTWKFEERGQPTKCVRGTINDYCRSSATAKVTCACEFTCKPKVTNPIPSWCVPDDAVMVPLVDDKGKEVLDKKGNVVMVHHCSTQKKKIGPNCELDG